MLNAVVGHFLNVLYIAMPTGCAAVAAYDAWHRGLASLPLQIGLCIVAIFAGLRLMSYALIIADVVGEAVGQGTRRAKATLAASRKNLGDAVSVQGGRELSHA